MLLRRFILVIFGIFLITSILYAEVQNIQESDQQINDFSLSGYGEKAQKTWDLSAKTADIFDNNVKLKEIVGNLYGEKEDIKLTADKGDFDKQEGRVHLEQNVIVATSSGAKLTTDSLDWDRKNQIVSTKDMVNIERGNMITVAQGAVGEPNLNKITLDKDVTVNINPQAQQQEASDKNKIIITCDGPLEIDYEKKIATFKNNVKVDSKDSWIYSDTMDVYFIMSDKDNKETEGPPNAMGNKIDKIVARGNVKILRGENISYSDEAIYTASDKKIKLSGKPRLIIYSTEDFNASVGN
jgi:LPS export ABC transporter protein LptC